MIAVTLGNKGFYFLKEKDEGSRFRCKQINTLWF